MENKIIQRSVFRNGKWYAPDEVALLRKGWAEEDFKDVLALWRTGLSGLSIAKKLGTDTSRVAAAVNALRRAGVDMPSRRKKS